jgi:ligand-binding sensor domain-containing protein
MKNNILNQNKLQNVFLIFSIIACLGFTTSRVIPDSLGEIPGKEKVKSPPDLISGHTVNQDSYISQKIAANDSSSKILLMNLETSPGFFRAAIVDNNNIKWFLTGSGIVSFNGEKWTLHNKNSKVPLSDIKAIAFEDNPHGQEIWLATSNGANVAALPVDAQSGATTYHNANTTIKSNNVVGVAVGKNPLRWFGTDKGISAFKGSKWLTPDYEEIYPEFMFGEFPVLSMATDLDGDTLYVGTNGAGIARVYSNEVDGISGASVFAQWGPMILPSDKIYSIYIAQDGAKWFGTDLGAARHTGQNSLENWTAFTTKDGLVNNFVQAITSGKDGKIWFGTKGGVSVFDGSSWISYTEKDGLISNNVLCIVVDKAGVVWIGTDKGVTSIDKGKFTNYN